MSKDTRALSAEQRPEKCRRRDTDYAPEHNERPRVDWDDTLRLAGVDPSRARKRRV